MRSTAKTNPIIVAGYLLLIGSLTTIIATSQERPVWDELFHRIAEFNLDLKTFGTHYLRNLNIAMGPLYAIILKLTGPVLHISESCRGVRLLSLGFFFGALFILRRILIELRREDFLAVIEIASIPIFTLMSVFGMSDMPTFFLFCLHLWILTVAISRARKHSRHSAWVAALAGLCLGIAVTGRQTFLVALAGGLAVVRRPPRWAIAYALAALPLPLALFAVWGGICPPRFAAMEKTIPFSLTHFLLAISQTAVCYLAFDWQFAWRRKKLTLSVIAISIAFIPIYDQFLPAFAQRLPMHAVISQHLGGDLLPKLLLALTFGLGGILILEIVDKLHKESDLGIRWFYWVGLSLTIAPGFITHMYSSRYIMASVVILALLSDQRQIPGYLRISRYIAGLALTITVLVKYLVQ